MKLVNLAQLPPGARVKLSGPALDDFWTVLRVLGDEQLSLYQPGEGHVAVRLSYARVVPSGWIGNPEGCETCPVPEGLRYEVMVRSGTRHPVGDGPRPYWKHAPFNCSEESRRNKDVIFYRILGLEEGWTDSPKEST